MIGEERTTEARARKGVGSSREVNLFAVHQFLAPYLGDPEFVPGTPSWTQLPDDDSAKWRAVLWAAMWWAVAENTRQEARAQAAENVWEGEDWTYVARQVQRRREIDVHRRAS